MTEAETVLWAAIRRGQLRCRFRRQHPIGPFLVDFICLRHRYIVEVDGGQHIDSAYDDARTSWLNERGFTVVRFRNNLVLGQLDMVTDTIAGHALSPGAKRGGKVPATERSDVGGRGQLNSPAQGSP